MASTKRLAKSRKFRRVMKEYGRGSLHSSTGDRVTSVDQARAIAFSEARDALKRRTHGRK